MENGQLSSVFFNLEKRNYNKKTVVELRLQDDCTTCNEKQILDQIDDYFKKLYTFEKTSSQEEYDDFIQHLQIPRLSDEDCDSLEGPRSNVRRMQKSAGLFSE